MFKMDLTCIAKVLHSDVAGGELLQATGFAIDSRKVQGGELFFAIPGERFDPHNCLQEVADKGAVAAVVEERQAVDLPQIVVGSSYQALGVLAKFWRESFCLPIAAVTGSNGKTTLKNMIASIMIAAQHQHDAEVLYSHGNLNSGFGLPLTLSRLGDQHRMAVLEMGMNSPGEIRYISKIARPQVAVINNISSAHVGNLGSLEGIADAKSEIFEGLDIDGTAVLNKDDDYYDYCRQKAGYHDVVTFSLTQRADFTASDITTGAAPTFMLHAPTGDAQVQLQLMGEHNVRNALAAAAVCHALAIPLEAIVQGLEQVQAVPGRLHQIPLGGDVLLIDDAYNANPGSMRAAANALAAYAGERIMIVGDMVELGADAESLHESVGAYAKAQGIDRLFAVGELSLFTAEGFGEGAEHFDTQQALIDAMVPLMNPQTTILVKGSHASGMTAIVEALQAVSVEVTNV